MTPRFTVCCLFYGDYPQLAERLLKSLYRPEWLDQIEVRVGCNQISLATVEILRSYTAEWGGKPLLSSARTWYCETNLHKYPMMRRIFYDRPLETPFTMWFDDDSWIRDSAPDHWFAHIANFMDTADNAGNVADMAGAVWEMKLGGNQFRWYQDQPWYGDKHVSKHHKVRFATGGWWVIRTPLLQKWNWPVPEINHRGGDVALGELCRQQGYNLRNFSDGVCINANDSGKCSSSPRRGHDEHPVGWHYQPGPNAVSTRPQAVPPEG